MIQLGRANKIDMKQKPFSTCKSCNPIDSFVTFGVEVIFTGGLFAKGFLINQIHSGDLSN